MYFFFIVIEFIGIFKALSNKCIYFYSLTRTVLKDLHDELKFAKLCEDPLMPITVDLREVENLVCELCSVENIVSIH